MLIIVCEIRLEFIKVAIIQMVSDLTLLTDNFTLSLCLQILPAQVTIISSKVLDKSIIISDILLTFLSSNIKSASQFKASHEILSNTLFFFIKF